MKSPIDIALHFLKFRPRTEFEIKQKLVANKISEGEIAKTVDVLLRNKLLDDSEFAKMYVRDRNLLKPTGAYLLRMEMKKLGLSDINIEEAMAKQDEVDLARRALESKGKYREAEFVKQAQFLQRRGFDLNTIYKILK